MVQFNAARTAYNSVFRKLFHVPRFDSASMHLVRRRIPTLKEIVRKNTFSLMSRMWSSWNGISRDVGNPVGLITHMGSVYTTRFLSAALPRTFIA